MSELNDDLAAIEASREALAIQAARDFQACCDAYKRLFATPDGQLVMADLRRRFVDRAIADPAKPAKRAFFREGCRSVVAFMYQMAEGAYDAGRRGSGNSGDAGRDADARTGWIGRE